MNSAKSSRGQRQSMREVEPRRGQAGRLIVETVVARLSREDAVDLLRSPVEESDAAFANPIGQLMPSQSLGSARPSSEPSVANCCSLQ